MKVTSCSLLGLALLVAACAGPSAPAPMTPAPAPAPAAVASVGLTALDRVAIEDVLASQAAAWNRGDLDAYMAGYLRSPDLVFTSGSKVRTGYDETFATYRAKYGTDRASMGTLMFKVLRIDPVGAGGAVVLGRWDLTRAAGPAGGIFTVVLARTEAGWLIVHDHTSIDTP